ncbi:MAG: hypothetical protein NTV06_02410 [candidate division Zixibacteria bacterium]|nr:hypothetical protein [candidate division Zixibacteria bacterium]
MKKTNLNKELKVERAKLNHLIEEAMGNNKLKLQDEEILKQSRKVDALVDKIQKENDKRKKSRGDSR